MPSISYTNSKGEKLSGVTTIISGNCGWSRRALMYWAWDKGMHGIDYRKTSTEAADSGTLAHAMIEAELKKKDWKECVLPLRDQATKEIIDKAETSYLNFIEWEERNQIKPIAIEPHLISEEYQFGATPDYIGFINGKVSLLDWKTGGRWEG